jgi:hypothetical protein
VNRVSVCALAGAILTALGGGCGGAAPDTQGALVAVLDVQGTPDVGMPLHITVQDDEGRQVEEGSLHNALRPLAFLLPAGSYRVTAMPGCADRVAVSKGTSQTVLVSIKGNRCSVTRT